MRDFVSKPDSAQKDNSIKPTRSGKVPPQPSRDAQPIAQLQRAIGNQAVLRLLRADDTTAAGGVPQEVVDHLKLREEWREVVYPDSQNLPTVGLGHLLTEKEKAQYKVGDRVPVDTLEAWAQADAKRAYAAGAAQAARLGVTDQSFINAMASVNFQLGTSWNTIHKKTWSYMVSHEWEKAALEAQDSSWYRQTPVRVQDFQAALRALGTNSATTAITQTASTDAQSTYKFKVGAPIAGGSATGNQLNVRKGPGIDYAKTGTVLQKGASVVIYGQVDGWYCIGAGQWASGQFIAVGKQAIRQPASPDLKLIAQAVWDAMFGGTGVGTDEDKVYANLAKLNKDKKLIRQFKEVYKATFGTDAVDDIQSEFSDNWLGNELTKALGYLNASVTPAPKTTMPASHEPGVSKSAEEKQLNEKLRDFVADLKKDPTYGSKITVTSAVRTAESDARAVLKNQKADPEYYKIFSANWKTAILDAIKDRDLGVAADFDIAVMKLSAWAAAKPDRSPHVAGRAVDFGLAGGNAGFRSFVRTEAEKRGFTFIDETSKKHYHVQM